MHNTRPIVQMIEGTGSPLSCGGLHAKLKGKEHRFKWGAGLPVDIRGKRSTFIYHSKNQHLRTNCCLYKKHNWVNRSGYSNVPLAPRPTRWCSEAHHWLRIAELNYIINTRERHLCVHIRPHKNTSIQMKQCTETRYLGKDRAMFYFKHPWNRIKTSSD